MSLPWPDLTTEEWEQRLKEFHAGVRKPVALTYRAKLAFLLGGEGSGNFGHAGRPGEVGGSAPDGEGGDSPIDRKRHEFMAVVKAGEDDNAHLDELRDGMRDAWQVWADDTKNRPRPLKPDGAAAKKLDSYKKAKALEEAFHKEFDASSARDRARNQQALEMLKVPEADRSALTFTNDEHAPLHPGVAGTAKRALATFRQFDGSGVFVPLRIPADKVEQFREVFGDKTPLRENADGTFSIPETLKLAKSATDRAHATFNAVNMSGAARNLDEVVYHEVAHHIEMRSGSVLKAAIEFRESQADKPREVYKLKTILSALNDTEEAVRGKFPDPYVGKIYPHDMATEVVSTGVASYILDPIRFAKDRPEHFKFIFDVMHGKYRGK